MVCSVSKFIGGGFSLSDAALRMPTCHHIQNSKASDRRRPFADAAAAGGIVKGIRVPDGKRLSNSKIKPKGEVAAEAASVAGGGPLIYMR